MVTWNNRPKCVKLRNETLCILLKRFLIVIFNRLLSESHKLMMTCIAFEYYQIYSQFTSFIKRIKINRRMCDEKYLRHWILYEFQKGSNAIMATQNLCQEIWIWKMVRILGIRQDLMVMSCGLSWPLTTTKEIAEEYQVSYSTVENHIKALWYVHKFAKLVPREISEWNRIFWKFIAEITTTKIYNCY